MKTRIAGAALAAAIVCGFATGVRPADASVISYSGFLEINLGYGDGGIQENITFDTVSKQVVYSYDEVLWVMNEDGSLGTQSSSGAQTGVGYTLYRVFDKQYGSYQIELYNDFANVSFYYSKEDLQNRVTWESAVGVVSTGTVSGDLPSLVPLPSAAPLFGAALLALGGVGWSFRRRPA